MTNLTQLLGDLDCYLAKERHRYWVQSVAAQTSGQPATMAHCLRCVDTVERLGERVREALEALDDRRQAL